MGAMASCVERVKGMEVLAAENTDLRYVVVVFSSAVSERGDCWKGLEGKGLAV
jgi:hypothetical protein